MSRNAKLILPGKILLVLAGVLLVQGCTVGPDYQKPKVDVPCEWQNKIEVENGKAAVNIQNWWRQFNDPMLDSLVEKTLANNPDLESALWRIEEARSLRDFSTGEYYPDINGSGFYNRSRQSEKGLTAAATGVKPDATNLHSAGFDAGWEIDLFGRIGRTVESAQASYEASIENYRDVLVTLTAEVARNYIDLRTAQTRLQFAQENVKIQKETLKLTQDRYSAELVPELDVVQAKLNVTNTESEIPSLRIQESQAINRLAVLAGVYPSQLYAQLSSYNAMPATSKFFACEMPADLLRKRPDIRRAERQLAAQTAKVGVATADLYPAFSLSGTFALEAIDLSDMGSIHSRTYGFGPSFRWNLFDGDRVRNLIKVEEARTNSLVASYKNTVLKAVEDVENSMVAYKEETDRNDSLAKSVDASKRSVELVSTLYKSGLTDFQNVLDMQRSLFIQQDKLAFSKGQILQDIIRVYKSLGGGWSEEAAIPAVTKTAADNQQK